MTAESETIELEELRAWVDGELDASRATQVQQAVSNSAELTEMTASLRASQLPYPDAMETAPAPDVPVELQQKIEDMLNENESLSESGTTPTPAKTNSIMAASLVAAIGMAITAAGGYFVGSQRAIAPIDSNASIAESLGFARAVASYQGFYVRETVEGTSDSNVSQLSARMLNQNDLKVEVPDFSAQGLQFVRAQQLGYGGQPVVQLVYLGNDGLPVAFCYMPEASGFSEVVFANHFGLETAEWVDNNQRFVIVANVDKSNITALYQSALSQM